MKTATTLRLPDELRTRVSRLAKKSGKTSHAWMVDALTEQVSASEKHASFVAEAGKSAHKVARGGAVYDVAEVFSYLRERANDSKARRPKPVRG